MAPPDGVPAQLGTRIGDALTLRTGARASHHQDRRCTDPPDGGPRIWTAEYWVGRIFI